MTGQVTLTVAKAGTGTGTIRAPVTTGDHQKVSLICNATCSTSGQDYSLGNELNLVAVADTKSGSVFKGWTCNGPSKPIPNTNVIKITMDAVKTCTATFDLK